MLGAISGLTGNTATLAGIAGGAGIIALITTGWTYIKQGFSYISSFVITSVEMDKELTHAIISYSVSSRIRSPLGTKYYSGHSLYVHPQRATETVALEVIKNNMSLIKHNKRYAILFVRNNDISLKSIRGWFDVESFILSAVQHFNDKLKRTKEINEKDPAVTYKRPKMSRFKMVRIGHRATKMTDYNSNPDSPEGKGNSEPAVVRTNSEVVELIQIGIFRLLRWNADDLVTKPEEGQTPFTGYPFPSEVKDAISYLDCWIKNEKWFRSRSIPWRLGWLLHGMPGTGKSTLVKAIGMSFDLPVFVIELNGMTNEELTDAWDNRGLSNTPCIVLIEDIDNVFHGREYVGATCASSTHLTFDCLLNCISGIKQSDGVLLMVTTNHLKYIDEAIGIPDKNTGKSTRPGRIDRIIELGNMKHEQRVILANFIMSDCKQLIDKVVNDGEGETAAQFQHRCGEIALKEFWKTHDKTIDI